MKKEDIRDSLSEVMDPEIPVLSLVDLGVIGDISIHSEYHVTVGLRPTFTGCPAIHQMKSDIQSQLYQNGFKKVDVDIVIDPPWKSDDITDRGREALRKYGYAPPPKGAIVEDIDILEHVQCPQCGGTNTDMESPFGPTLCRSLHYCRDCRESFQQIKPLS